MDAPSVTEYEAHRHPEGFSLPLIAATKRSRAPGENLDLLRPFAQTEELIRRQMFKPLRSPAAGPFDLQAEHLRGPADADLLP